MLSNKVSSTHNEEKHFCILARSALLSLEFSDLLIECLPEELSVLTDVSSCRNGAGVELGNWRAAEGHEARTRLAW
jgi:hypothetical protein